MDTTELLQETHGQLLSHNLFTYCLNNPVNMVDIDGDFAQLAMAGVYGGYLSTTYAAGGANFWNPLAGYCLEQP